jgi:hypothetical protein
MALDVAPPQAPADAAGQTEPTERARRSLFRRTGPACLILLAVYMALSLFNDPHGFLGTDTGGKVATLDVMVQRGTLDPNVGYWAERWDPAGKLHPLFYTSHLAGKWVNITTLPALYAAYPLYKFGGYRTALLIPMAGGVLAALAAAALARRMSNSDGWAAFWIVGLASPITIYALDLWEHTLGVALMAWAIVFLLDVANGRAGWKGATVAGLFFGTAATMRTEALVYGAVATIICLSVALWRRRQLVRTAAAGLAVLAGLAIPLVANQTLERATIGASLRSQRATGTVQGASGDPLANRADEAMYTFTSPGDAAGAGSYVLGAGLLALLALFAVRSTQGSHARPIAVAAAAGAGAVYLIRAGDGLGFVPGLIAATPLAAVGLALAWRRRPPTGDPATVVEVQERVAADATRQLVIAVALLALVPTWALEFTGGAGPQWGGRYILTSGLLLATAGVTCLPLMAKWARTTAVALAVAVTVFGLSWMSVRTHDAARAEQALARRPEPLLVSRIAHLPREGGAYVNDRKWLTAVSDADETAAANVVTAAGYDRFGLVELDAAARPHDIPGFTRGATSTLDFLPGVTLRITDYKVAR